MADSGGQQVWSDHVATDEDALLAWNLVVLVGADQAFAVIKFFQTGKIDRLTNSGNNQVGRNIIFGAFLDDLFPARPSPTRQRAAQWRGHPRRPHRYRRTPPMISMPSASACSISCLLAFILSIGSTRKQYNFRAFIGRNGCNIMRDMAGDHVLGTIFSD